MSKNETTKNYWDNYNIKYTNNWVGASKKALSELEINFLYKHLHQQHPQRILDIGVGNGRILSGLIASSNNNSEIFGIDISEKMVEICNQNFSGQTKIKGLAVCDISCEPAPYIDLDLVSAIRVIKYNKDWIKILENVSKSMKQHGIFVFTMLNKNSLSRFSDYGMPVYLTNKKEMLMILEKNGFELLEITSFSRLPAFLYHINNELYAKVLLLVEKTLEILAGRTFCGKEFFISARKK